MRKNIMILSIALIMALCPYAAYAQDDGDEDDSGMPPGMVARKVGGSNIIMPKDAIVRKQGDALIYEDINEYAARKFMEIEKRLSKIDAALESIHKELQEPKK